MNNFIFIFLLPFLFFNCSKERKKITEEEYKEWMNTPHPFLLKKKEIGDITVELILIPSETLYLKNGSSDALLKDYEGMVSFVLALSNIHGINMLKYKADEIEYQKRIFYFTNEIKKNITIRQNGKEDIYPVDVIMDRSYGLSPRLSLNILFKPFYIDNDFTFSFDEHIFNLGPINFHYGNNEISQIPKIEQE